MALTSRSAIRGVAPHDVVGAVESFLDGATLRHARKAPDDAQPDDIVVAEAHQDWTTLTWPAFFAPRDLAACRWLSRELHTVVSAVTTTDDEGWSHTLVARGSELDRFHSYPGALAWDGEDAAALAQEWSGDFETVARVIGADPCHVRRHFCQATSARRDHPGRDRDGYLGLWAALGIRPKSDQAPHAVLEVEPVWRAVAPVVTAG